VIFAVPATTPVTAPALAITEATALLLLLHTPPAALADNVVIPVSHITLLPVIAGTAGTVFTVIIKVEPAVPHHAVTI
jgi:hypothetical protein